MIKDKIMTNAHHAVEFQCPSLEVLRKAFDSLFPDGATVPFREGVRLEVNTPIVAVWDGFKATVFDPVLTLQFNPPRLTLLGSWVEWSANHTTPLIEPSAYASKSITEIRDSLTGRHHGGPSAVGYDTFRLNLNQAVLAIRHEVLQKAHRNKLDLDARAMQIGIEVYQHLIDQRSTE